MKPLFLASVTMLSLLCAACASHRVAGGPGRAGAGAQANAPASSKGADYHPGELFGITELEGTANDKHSDVASKTPDGGKSAASVSAKPPADATPAPVGTDAPSTDADKAAEEKFAADLAAVLKAASDGDVDATTKDPNGKAATDSIDGSDPSIGRPSTAPSRKLT
jgi:hypothetical protein